MISATRGSGLRRTLRTHGTALIARSVGAEGERVEDPAELMAALRRGLARVRGGQTAVVDVTLE